MKIFHSTKTFHLFFLFSLILFRVYSGFCMVLGVLSYALMSGNGCNIVLCKRGYGRWNWLVYGLFMLLI